MQLIEVTDAKTAKEFIEVAVALYKNDLNWIRPLDKDIDEVFNEEKNKAYRFGEAIRWVIKNDEGKYLGRIAAFVNKKYKNKGDDVPVGGIGFFECVNNQDIADLLLDNAKHWLLKKGMEAMDGPINFGERDRWWGLVTKGFQEPLYCMNYNPPYYVELFEQYGFQLFFNQVCFNMKPKEPLSEKIHKRHDLFATNPEFAACHLQKNKLEKFAVDFVTVYNKAWAGHGGLKQMAKEQAVILFKTMKPVMDEKIIWFAYHKEEPIAIFINLPDLNQWFKYLNGKFGLLQKLQFLWTKMTKPNKRCVGIVFGVVPEWQGKGIDAYIIAETDKVMKAASTPYTEYEMQWIGDFNPKMLNVAESLGDVSRNRTLTTYRYLFDRTKEYKRHPMVG